MGGGYDILLVAGARQMGIAEVVKFAKAINLDADKILGDWIVCIPGFTLDKYRKLQRSRLSIVAINCFGGQIHHTLGLQFFSPFINLFLDAKEYIRLLHRPRVYMEEKLVLKKIGFNGKEKFEYPIVMLGNISLYMSHYRTFDEAVEKWNERKQRINWYNLFVMATTESREIAEQFDELPHGKKVCFVPFKSDLYSSWYIDPKFNDKRFFGETRVFDETVFDLSQGRRFYYDVFDMLLYGKKTPLIEM